jgi:hypothetical protein
MGDSSKGSIKSEDSKWLDLVVQQVRSLRYGVVEIVVHDSRVTQIEKTERLRLDKTPPDNSTKD